MAARVRWRGTTTERGYGWSHVKILKTAIASWKPGDLCAQCGWPMWHRWTTDRAGNRISALHLGHTPDRTGYIGLCHARCNTSEGATRGNQLRGRARQWQTARQW